MSLHDRPNILFIQTDQLAANVLSAYGGTAVTPNIDRLAAEGVIFESAYCNYPLCAPSRFSMASGLLASKIGAWDNAAEFPASIPTYAHYLRALGYRTCLSGKMHFVGPDQLHGFEKRTTPDIYPGDFTWTADWNKQGFEGATDIRMLTASGICARSVQIDYDDLVTFQARQELFDMARTEDRRPFFLQVSYTHPHDPYLCRQEPWDLYTGADIPAPKVGTIPEAENDPHSLRVLRQHGLADADIPDEVIQRARHGYYGSVSYIDDQVGAVLDALHLSGFAENTIIIFGSDHGEMLGERGLWLKKTFFEQALRIPLLIHAPGRYAPRRVKSLVSLVDLLPTFAGLASNGEWDGPVESLDGTDLGPMLEGAETDRPLLAELTCEGLTAPIFLLRRGDMKLVTGGDNPDMLHDLAEDPLEMANLAGDPAHTRVLEALKNEVADLWDSERISQDVRLSQHRRLLIRDAHQQGVTPVWDYAPLGDSGTHWYRGAGNYNDWAFAYLAQPESGSGD